MSTSYCVRLFVELAPDLESCQKMRETSPDVTPCHPYHGKGWTYIVSLNPFIVSALSTLKGWYSLSAKGLHQNCQQSMSLQHAGKASLLQPGFFFGRSPKIISSHLWWRNSTSTSIPVCCHFTVWLWGCIFVGLFPGGIYTEGKWTDTMKCLQFFWIFIARLRGGRFVGLVCW